MSSADLVPLEYPSGSLPVIRRARPVALADYSRRAVSRGGGWKAVTSTEPAATIPKIRRFILYRLLVLSYCPHWTTLH